MTTLPQLAIPTLHEAKQQRKATEQEVQSLRNRIAMLQMEQEKTKKSISKTEQRAFDIYRAKVRQEQKHKEREAAKQQTEGIKGTSHSAHVEQIQRVQLSKLSLRTQRFQDATSLKQQLSHELEAKLKEDAVIQWSLKNKAKSIKSLERQLLDSVREKREQVHQNVRRHIQKQTIQELELEKEQQLMRRFLEQKENELVQQLQQSQMNQRNTITLYKSAKSMRAEEFQRTFTVLKKGGSKYDSQQYEIKVVKSDQQPTLVASND